MPMSSGDDLTRRRADQARETYQVQSPSVSDSRNRFPSSVAADQER